MSDQPTTTGPRHLHVIVAGFIGNVLEWYDFAVYGFFAATIGTLFFPSDDPTSSLIAAFGTFAAGFLMRPIGSILFGHIGDRLGRRRLLVVSALAMGFATFAVGLLPTHVQIGATAAVLMVCLRMVQGLSVGGEYVGSGVFLAESAPIRRRGFFASFSTAGLMSGVLLGSLVGALVTSLLTADQITEWGWRLPFFAGLLLGVVALVLRLTVADAPRPEVRARLPVVEAFARHGKSIFHAAALVIVVTAGWYVTVIYVPIWLVQHRGVARALALEINSANLALSILAGLIAAAVSDRVGRKPVLMAGALGATLLTYPLFLLISRDDPAVFVVAQCILGILSSIYAFVLPATLSEMFPWRVRTTSANFSLNVTFAIFGGTAPMIATWLVAETGGLGVLAIYLSVLAALSAVGCLFLTDRRGVDLS